MCGIFGIYNSSQKISPQLVQAATDRLLHRGPDGSGIWINKKGNVGIGHTRLSIVDLSHNADQPFKTERFIISFNGEIYNFRALKKELEEKGYAFKTTSDTEVLIRVWEKWGIDGLKKLNGCFAFILYDLHLEKLYIVRDPLGEKQIVYTKAGNGDMLFASEVKALLKHPNVLCRPNVNRFLEDHICGLFLDQTETYFEGIFTFPAGSIMCFDLIKRTSTLESYYELPQNGTVRVNSEEELFTKFHNLLTDSVKLRLDADAAMGSILSGGLDSSYITALAGPLYQARQQKQFPCFTVYYDTKKNLDLQNALALTNSIPSLKTEAIQIQKNISEEYLKQCTKALEQPINDTSILSLYKLYEVVGTHKIKTVLNGEGSDELWLGYYSIDQLFKIPRRHITEEYLNWYLFESSVVGDFIKGSSTEKKARTIIQKNLENNFRSYQEAEPLQRLVYYSIKTHLAEIFALEDRCSMAHGVEVRVPYVDLRLVELALQTSTRLKVKDGREKYVVRQASRGNLPTSIRNRVKQGFPSIPKEYALLDSIPDLKDQLKKSSLLQSIYGEKSLSKLVQYGSGKEKWILYSYLLMEQCFFL